MCELSNMLDLSPKREDLQWLKCPAFLVQILFSIREYFINILLHEKPSQYAYLYSSILYRGENLMSCTS